MDADVRSEFINSHVQKFSERVTRKLRSQKQRLSKKYDVIFNHLFILVLHQHLPRCMTEGHLAQ